MRSHERIPLHEHVDGNSGGPIAASTIVAVVGSPSTSGAVTGSFVLTTDGGQDGVKAHGSVGATETIDPADGNVHTLTLTANCTATIAAPSGPSGATLELWVTQDGTGGWSLTLAASGGSFAWDGATPTLPTTATTTFRILLERVPGTTNDWIGDLVGGASFATPTITYGTPAAGSAGTAVRSDAVISKPTEADLSLSAVTTNDVSTSKHGFAPTLPNDATKYLDGSGAYSTPAGSGVSHVHVAYETHTSDGATTTFTLDQVYEPGSVMAFNRTAGTILGVTEVAPDQATISAAGTAADLLDFHYAASVI